MDQESKDFFWKDLEDKSITTRKVEYGEDPFGSGTSLVHAMGFFFESAATILKNLKLRGFSKTINDIMRL